MTISTPIKALCLDVDGVLTDGKLYYGQDGELMKVFHVSDGQGLVSLRKAGFTLAILSARSHPAVVIRAQDLGIHTVIQGSKDKLKDFQTLCEQTEISAENWCYVGDDLPDIQVIKAAGLGVAVANAVGPAKAVADMSTSAQGGQGAVREVCEYLLSQDN